MGVYPAPFPAGSARSRLGDPLTRSGERPPVQTLASATELLGKQPELLFPGHPQKTPNTNPEDSPKKKEPFHGNAGGKVPRGGGTGREPQ